MEHSMGKEKRFSVGHGIEGCLVSCLCQLVLVFTISLVLTQWLELISGETERIIKLPVWLFAVWYGGYFAARRGRTTGWTNSLVVGVLAEVYLAARIQKRTSLLEMMDDPGSNWLPFAALGLTIPAAIMGGIVWEKTCKLDEAGGYEQSEPPSEPEAQEE
jgi:hypothetical protein